MLFINRTLLRLAKGLWGWIFAIVLVKMVSLIGVTAFARIVTGYLGSLFDPSLTMQDAGRAIASAFAASMITLAAELVLGELTYRCTSSARTSLRRQIFSKVLELDAGRIEVIGPVSAITASVDAVESMQSYYSMYLPSLIYCFLAPVYLFFQLKSASLPAAVLLFAVAFIVLPVNNVFRMRIERLKTEYWSRMEDLTAYFLESVQGLTTFKLFGRDEARTAVLTEKADAFNRKIMDFMRVNFSSFLLTDGMLYGSILAAVFLACAGLVRGTLSYASAFMVLMLSYSFFASVRQLMGAAHAALAGIAAAEKVSVLLDTDTSRPLLPNAPQENPPFDGIRAEHLCHAYAGRSAALTDVSLEIARGSVTALAGLSGCGKSTLAGLLMRFFDPASGKLYLEGRDYLSMPPEELRRHVMMVPQSVSLFTGSIADNLRIAVPDATDAQLLEVLDKVQLSGWLSTLPEGLDAPVGDAGAKLSGGQRQKIGIARALLSPAEYIIFDEATSSVDPQSEEEIWRCIAGLAKTRTLILISHRLSTVRDADRIYVLDRGKICEVGRHEELMVHGGLYARLVTEQEALERQIGADAS